MYTVKIGTAEGFVHIVQLSSKPAMLQLEYEIGSTYMSEMYNLYESKIIDKLKDKYPEEFI